SPIHSADLPSPGGADAGSHRGSISRGHRIEPSTGRVRPLVRVAETGRFDGPGSAGAGCRNQHRSRPIVLSGWRIQELHPHQRWLSLERTDRTIYRNPGPFSPPAWKLI